MEMFERACEAWGVELTDMHFYDGVFQGKATYRGEPIKVHWATRGMFDDMSMAKEMGIMPADIDASHEFLTMMLNSVTKQMVTIFKARPQ